MTTGAVIEKENN